jgi:hypothetical protein
VARLGEGIRKGEVVLVDRMNGLACILEGLKKRRLVRVALGLDQPRAGAVLGRDEPLALELSQIGTWLR